MNKRDLMDALLTDEELEAGLDTAYPQPWADKVRELGLDPQWIVWSYAEPHTFGAPIDLAHRFLEKYAEVVPELLTALIKAREVLNEECIIGSINPIINSAIKKATG